MKNSKDKSILKLLLVFILYYVIYYHMPDLLKDHSKLINMIIKDIVLIIVITLIYFKDILKEFRSFRKSNYKWIVIVWAIGIFLLLYFLPKFLDKYCHSIYKMVDKSSDMDFSKYYKISKVYAFFKTVIYIGIIESILYSLSFRKALNNKVLFIIVSSLVYTYFPMLFTGFSINGIFNPLLIRFIPCILYNIAYIKNNNNIISLITIVIIRNSILFILYVI